MTEPVNTATIPAKATPTEEKKFTVPPEPSAENSKTIPQVSASTPPTTEQSKSIGQTVQSGNPDVKVQISQLPRFYIHFRRNNSTALNEVNVGYQGAYGFDWLREEYIYDEKNIGMLNDKTSALFQGEATTLVEQYTHHDGKPIVELASINTYSTSPTEGYIVSTRPFHLTQT